MTAALAFDPVAWLRDALAVADGAQLRAAIWSFVVVDVDHQLAAVELASYAAVQQRQVLEDWAPHWRSLATVRVATADLPPLAGEVQIQIHRVAPATQQAALGFHDRQPDGTPIIHVFLDLAARFGEAWTAIASHEVLETLGDPYLRGVVQTPDGFFDSEVADRVQAVVYSISGVVLSNFNLPACFFPPTTLDATVRYDFVGVSTVPNEIRPGGYAQRFDPSQGWIQVGAPQGYRAALTALGLTRTNRRRKLSS